MIHRSIETAHCHSGSSVVVSDNPNEHITLEKSRYTLFSFFPLQDKNMKKCCRNWLIYLPFSFPCWNHLQETCFHQCFSNVFSETFTADTISSKLLHCTSLPLEGNSDLPTFTWNLLYRLLSLCSVDCYLFFASTFC